VNGVWAAVCGLSAVLGCPRLSACSCLLVPLLLLFRDYQGEYTFNHKQHHLSHHADGCDNSLDKNRVTATTDNDDKINSSHVSVLTVMRGFALFCTDCSLASLFFFLPFSSSPPFNRSGSFVLFFVLYSSTCYRSLRNSTEAGGVSLHKETLTLHNNARFKGVLLLWKGGCGRS
jgi:hypothetical protein